MKIKHIPLEEIHPPALQPRLQENAAGIEELITSIKRHGLISPLTVTLEGEGYRLLAGNRRLQALKELGAKKAACNVVEVDEALADEITIAENLIRLNLSPVEEAYAFAIYLDRSKESHDELATRLGKERTYVTRRLLLLDLDDMTLGALEDGAINLSQALLLRRVDNPKVRERFIEHTIAFGANVRTMTFWLANYEKEAARMQAEEGRELEPSEVEIAREVFMACDRCGEATSYDSLRPAYLCAKCKRLVAMWRLSQEEV